jgi:hypothetical protein
MPNARFCRSALVPVIVVTVATLACSTASDPSRRVDYLEPAVRERVDALESELARQPTTVENYRPRVELLWHWINASARARRVPPVDSPFAVSRVHSQAALNGAPSAEALRLMDAALHELLLKDDDPLAAGMVRLVSDAALVAGEWGTVVQTWTAGGRALEAGAVFLLGAQFMADQGDLQHEDPGADNYVTAVATAGVELEKTRIPMRGRHASFHGFQAPHPLVAFRLTAGRLAVGDTVTFTYGDRSGGSRGFLAQSLSTDNLLLPIYVDLDGSGRFLTLDWPPIRVTGRPEAARVTVLAPSVVAIGERFDLTVRTVDRFGNRSTGPVPAFEVRLGDRTIATVAEGGAAAARVANLSLREPGIARLEVRAKSDGLRGVSNPIRVESDPEHRVLWGETHGHAGYAEGQGGGEQFFEYAQEDARLDFVSLTDHDDNLDDAEWREMGELSRRYTAGGELVAFLGYEWSSYRDLGGHHNVLFRTARDRRRVPNQEAPRLADLYSGLRARNDEGDVLVIPHAHQAGDWTMNDSGIEKLVEIASMHGTFEWFGNRYLQNGFEVGFISASDDHRSKPGLAPGLFISPQVQGGGLAAVLAPAKTPDAIFDALRSKRAYATSGDRILLDATLNGHAMGTRQPASDRRRIRCAVAGTAPIDRIDVVRNGELVLARGYLFTPLTDHAFVAVGFESSSEVMPPLRDNPRLYRVWHGFLEIEGAKLLAVTASGFKNPYIEWARTDPERPGRVEFHAETRGGLDTLILELEGASRSTEISFQLDEARESGFAPPLVRQPAIVPAAAFTMRLSDLVDHRLERELELGPHVDRVSLQVIDPGAPLDRELEFDDLGTPGGGDYYYVRVTQLDGEMAWSSPFWVGERRAVPR